LKLSEKARASLRKIQNPPVRAQEKMKAEPKRGLEVTTEVTNFTCTTVGLKHLISNENLIKHYYEAV